MSTSRASKRRKLSDHDHDSDTEDSPAPTTFKAGARRSQTDRILNLPQSSSTTSRSEDASAQKMWKLAKEQAGERKAGARRKKDQEELELYDDIEGGNVGQEPWGRLDKPAKRAKIDQVRKEEKGQNRDAKREKTRETGNGSSSPAKKGLDPLRNQKGQETSSPRKPTSSSLGFFKKFARPQTTEAPGTNGTNGVLNKNASILQSAALSQSSHAPHRAANDRWTYGKPKKTFEDEIRELEEQARKKAGDAESEDELAANDEPQRSSTKRHSLRKPVAEPVVEQKAKSSPTPRQTKLLDRRKAKKVEVEDTPMPDVEDDAESDSMEIPDSEDEVEPVAPVKVVEVVGNDEPKATPKKATSRLPKKRKSDTSPILKAAHLQCIQRALLEKLTGQRTIPLTELETEYAKVSSVISQTVTAGESNSMLLIGARECGKTALVNQIIREQAKKHSEDFHVVRLNGFIHTDDKIALRDIWRQLGREMELDEEEAVSKNYADTMSKLLALLSHPEEMGTGNADHITKSVIFILDEFELFATHPRQMLLYNLFDIAQSRKAPIAVLGLTTRIDVAESLEKRVKSRFSHRYVHLALPKSFGSFKRICSAALSLTSGELADDEHALFKSSVSDTLSTWNRLALDILETGPWDNFLHRLYYTTKSAPDFFAPLMLAVATMPVSSDTTTGSILEYFSGHTAFTSLQPPDSKLNLLGSLSTIQLALLICAARLTNIYSAEIISFALVYEEYKVLASKAKLQASASGALAQGAGSRVWGKEIAKNAWRELVDCGLMIEDGRAGGTGRVDVGLEEIGMSGVELGAWGRWCKEI